MLRRLLVLIVIAIVVLGSALALFARGVIGNDAVRRALEQQLSAALGEPVSIGSLGATFVPGVALDLHDVSVGRPARATIARIAITVGLRGLFSRRVEEARVIVSNSRVPVGIIGAIAGALANGGSSADGSGFTIVSVRTLELRHVEVVGGPKSLIVDLESSLEGDRLDITQLTAQSQATRLRAHGAFTSMARHVGSFTATANRLDLDELLAVVSSVRLGDGPGAREAQMPLDVTIDVTAPAGEIGGYVFQSLAATIRVIPNQVAVQPVRFDVFHGKYDGALRIAPSAAGPAMSLSGRVAGIDMATLLAAMNGSRSMTGTLGGALSLGGRGTSAAEVLRSARGTGQILIADGVVPGLEMVRAVVLAFGKPSGAPLPGSGSAFTRLAGTFALADQVLRTENVTFASRDFDMTGSATVRLPSGVLEMHANVVLSAELTAQAGTDLRRYAQEDGRVVIPATITGTVAQPSVSLDVAAAINRALQNEIKRKLKGWLDRIIR